MTWSALRTALCPALIKAGAIQKLDRSQLPNWKNLDPVLMNKLEANDPGNQYGYPYMWGMTGIGYNVEKIKAILVHRIIARSWALFFDENNIKKLSQCGVAIIDNPTRVLPILNLPGLATCSHEPEDYKESRSGAAENTTLCSVFSCVSSTSVIWPTATIVR